MRIRHPCPVLFKTVTFYFMDNLEAVEINLTMFILLFILFSPFCFLLHSVLGSGWFFLNNRYLYLPCPVLFHGTFNFHINGKV